MDLKSNTRKKCADLYKHSTNTGVTPSPCTVTCVSHTTQPVNMACLFWAKGGQSCGHVTLQQTMCQRH